MTPRGNAAAARAERERIAQLADDCGARYSAGYEWVFGDFAAVIRSGRPNPPWWAGDWSDPLAEETT